MTKITEKQLIDSLKQMKEIKPRAEWAILLKSQILAEEKAEVISQPARFANFEQILSSVFSTSRGTSQKKLAYSFAVILFFVVGVFGFAELMPAEKASQQTASLTSQTQANIKTSDLNSKISDLAAATKAGNSTKDINSKVSALAKSLKNTQIKDPQTIQEIVKTLADISSTDLSTNSDIKDLVENQIADLQKTTLTSEQNNTLTQIEDLYKQEKYADALEKILLINK